MLKRLPIFIFLAFLLLGHGIGQAADKDLKRLVETGPNPQAVCEALTKKSLLGYEGSPQKVKPGTCTCAPNNIKGNSDAVECVLYFTTGY